jgi:uncharacterized repeat protein (TIGR03806 family)
MGRCFLLAASILAALSCAVFAPTADTPRAPSVSQEAADAVELPEGFSDTVVATGLTGATAMAVAPDGRVFVCEQTGTLRVIENDILLPEPFVKLTVDSFWERGLIGVALDPDFAKNHYIYVCYVAPKPFPHHCISRFTEKDNTAVADSQVILLEGDDQTKLGGAQPAGHQGGHLHFGKDGKLYVGIGEQTAGAPSQKLDTFQGKMLRINSDGSIPADNQFFEKAKGKYRAIWAIGLRNPFAFAVQPGTGRIFINDVGDARLEEINEGVAGANYGWPEAEGPSTNPKFRNPIHAYDHHTGRSITGGAFYNPAKEQFPKEYVGKYLFADFMDNWVRVLDPDRPDSISVFATGLVGPVDLQVAPDGSLYCLCRKMWVKDNDFKPATGELHRISYPANTRRPVPRVTAQPADAVAAAGDKATFRIEVAGDSKTRFRWSRDGVPIAKADGPTLTLSTVSLGDDGARFRCAVSNENGSTRTRSAILRVVCLRDPPPSPPLVRGLECRYFKGPWTHLPDFDSLKPSAEEAAANIGDALGKHDDKVGCCLTGYLDVPKDGVYSFTLSSGGWSRLFVGNAEVAATSGEGGPGKASGYVGLKAGKHPLKLLYAQRGERPLLGLRWASPGLDEQQIPPDRLMHPDASRLIAPTMDPAGGSFNGPTRVHLTTPTAECSIRYTTDGTEPTARSPMYQEPLEIKRSARVVAKAFHDKTGEASPEATSTFTIEGDKPYGLDRRDLVTTLNVPRDPKFLPALLSETGVFRSVKDLTPNPGLIPYDVNSPLWSDGAVKQRWIALPGDARIGFAPKGEWKFPAGTVFVKHFELGTDEARPEQRRRLETRLLVVGEPGGEYGVTYRWRADQTDAELLTGIETEDVAVATADGLRRQKWVYPSRNDCLVCHTPNAGFVLGVKTRQLNGSFTYPAGAKDNQLRTWNHLGLFDPALKEAQIDKFDRLAAVMDKTARLEHRIRSYLDANCAQCHRPGGARGLFDARFDTPLEHQNLIKGPVAAADLGVREAVLTMPGDPERSVLYMRMKRREGSLQMPPLASHKADSDALRVMAEWIESLSEEKQRRGGMP